jgi:two-component system, cell cycle sensor histidine kinase and response regulator CckA
MEQLKPGPEGVEDGRRGIVLVVDDNDEVLRLVAGELRRRGYRILEANGGREALDAALASDGPIEVLLTDVEMPDLDGFALWRLIREMHPGCKVVFMSGEDQPAAHAEAFVRKPFKLEELAAVVSRQGEAQA